MLFRSGKECHNGCVIRQTMGDCIMPREGVFARVIQGGTVSVGDSIQIMNQEKSADILTKDVK